MCVLYPVFMTARERIMFSFSRKMDALKVSLYILTICRSLLTSIFYLISAKPLLVKKRLSICKQFISIQNMKTKILRTRILRLMNSKGVSKFVYVFWRGSREETKVKETRKNLISLTTGKKERVTSLEL